MFKKILLSFLALTTLSLSVLTPAASAQTWYLQDYSDWYEKVYSEDDQDEIFGERYTAAQVEWIIYGIIAFVFNHVLSDQSVLTCLTEYPDNPEECADEFVGAITAFNVAGSKESLADSENIFKRLFLNNPASGIGYTREVLSKFNLVPEAKAQGFGFEGGSAVRQLWVAVRNLTYFLAVFIIIVMSFMIMFRVKLSPQTVISVQSALPKVVITLILITFSYAIAGFIIDLMYVVIGLAALVLSNSGLFNNPNDTFIGMWNDLTGTGLGQGIIGIMVFYLLSFMVASFYALVSNVYGVIGLLFGGTMILWVIIVLVAVIVLFILMLKIIWMLIKTFVNILLLIAGGPLFILFGALGGSGFGGWIKNLAANLAVYPIVGIMFAVSFIFLASALPEGIVSDLAVNMFPFDPNPEALQNSPWVPPFLPGGRDLDIVWLFSSLAIVALIPKTADIIKGILSGRPIAYGTAIGEAFGPITTAPRKIDDVARIGANVGRAWRTRLGTRGEIPLP